MSLHIWHCQSPHKPSSCATFMLNSHWDRVATGKKKSCTYYVHRVASVVSNSLRLCRLVACQASLSGRGFLQARLLERNTGCHTLLEHCISCCPSRQLPRVPGAARTPATQAAAPPPHLALTGANPSPPGQPQELNPNG